MSLRDELLRVYEANGKRLSPQLVVDDGRRRGSYFHDRLEWNDRIGGEEWRKVQAAELIRSVKIEWVTDDPSIDDKIRAFHSMPKAESQSYVPIEEIVGDEIAEAVLLRQAERAWRDLFRRYGHLKGFIEAVRRDAA